MPVVGIHPMQKPRHPRNPAELDRSKPVYVNCFSGLRSYIACRILSGYGFTCYNLSGGFRFYDIVTSDEGFDSRPKHACGVEIGAAGE